MVLMKIVGISCSPLPQLITELQSLGLRFQGQLSQRKGGAGPAEGGTFLIERIPVSLPIGSEYVSNAAVKRSES